MKALEYHITKLLPGPLRKKDEQKNILEKRNDKKADRKIKQGQPLFTKPIFKAKKFDLL